MPWFKDFSFELIIWLGSDWTYTIVGSDVDSTLQRHLSSGTNYSPLHEVKSLTLAYTSRQQKDKTVNNMLIADVKPRLFKLAPQTHHYIRGPPFIL